MFTQFYVYTVLSTLRGGHGGIWLRIPATQEAKIVKIAVQGQPKQKVRDTPSQQISQVW
jgi:hypothetical protein